MGHAFPILGSYKHTLNTRSSTKAKIVGADDFMPPTACKLKDTKLKTVFCIRTKIVLSFSRKTERPQAASK